MFQNFGSNVIWGHSNIFKTFRLNNLIDFDETRAKRSLARGSFQVVRWSANIRGYLGLLLKGKIKQPFLQRVPCVDPVHNQILFMVSLGDIFIRPVIKGQRSGELKFDSTRDRTSEN